MSVPASRPGSQRAPRPYHAWHAGPCPLGRFSGKGPTGAVGEHLLDAAALRTPTSTRGKPGAPHPQLSLAATPRINATTTSQSPRAAPQLMSGTEPSATRPLLGTCHSKVNFGNFAEVRPRRRAQVKKTICFFKVKNFRCANRDADPSREQRSAPIPPRFRPTSPTRCQSGSVCRVCGVAGLGPCTLPWITGR